MSKRILIVESDAGVSSDMRSALESRGFAVEETMDGKGSVERIRSERPELVLLAVDLAAGQNGYLICGKLKKDEELKRTPVVIVGNPDGFAQHKRLKTRADEYVSKPVDLDELVGRVGALIGFPEPAAEPEMVDDSFGLSDLVEEAPSSGGGAPHTEETVAGDPELDALDSAFDQLHNAGHASAAMSLDEQPVGADEASMLAEDQDFPGLDTGDSQGWGQPSMDAPPQRTPAPAGRGGSLRPAPGTPLGPRIPTASGPASPLASDAAEMRALRAKVAELQAALEDAGLRAAEADSRIKMLTSEVEAKAAEAEAARSSGSKNDKEFFALKDLTNKKDKEILRLKSELNDKDKEIVELRDQETQLEQQVSQNSSELSQKDAQLKGLNTKVDQLAADRRRVDGELKAAKDEQRTTASMLSETQQDLEATTRQMEAQRVQMEGEIRQAQGEAAGLRQELEETQRTLQETRGALEDMRHVADATRAQVENLQGQNAQLHGDVEAARAVVASQQQQFGEESAQLRGRIAELEDHLHQREEQIRRHEEQARRQEERANKLYARIQGDEKLRDKTKKALSIAMQLLEEPPQDIGSDEDEASAA